MIGSLARNSAHTNAAIPSTAIARKPPTVTSVQSPVCLLVRPTSRKLMATEKIAPPRMSKLRVARGFLTVGRSRQMKYSDTIPIGMLT